MYGRATKFYCSSYPLLAQYAMAWKKWIACTPLSHNALLESHCFDATFASLPFHSVMQYGLETIQIVKERFESVQKFPQCLFKCLWFWVESVAHCWRLIVKIPLEFSVWYPIFKGAKLTRSTSAHALPLFLPRPESSGTDLTSCAVANIIWKNYHTYCIHVYNSGGLIKSGVL